MSTSRNFARAGRRLAAFSREMSRRLPGGIRQIGEEIMTDAKASSPGRGVPVDKGALRNSGKVKGPDAKGSVVLSFGDSAVVYALIQHEVFDFHHTVGEPRYLTRAVGRWRPGGSAAISGLKRQAALAARLATAAP